MPGSFYTTGIVTVAGQAASLITALDRLLTGVSAVKRWDGASTFTNNTAEARTEGGTPFKLVDVATDYLLVGFDVKARALRIDFSTVMAGGGALTFQYWNGSTWATLTVVDGTLAWTQDGEITWTAPSDWATTALDSLTAYYIRIKCASNPSTDPEANFVVYNWTIYDDAAGTNQKVYKSIGEDGTRNLLLWVSHVAGDASHARAILYESWNNVAHTGADLTPLTATLSGGVWWRVSVTADATARALAAYVSRDLAALFTYTGDTASQAHPQGCGIMASPLLAGDVWANLIWGGDVTGNLSGNSVKWCSNGVTSSNQNNMMWAQRQYTGAAGSVAARFLGLDTETSAGSAATYPNPPDGGLLYQPTLINVPTVGCRGVLTSAWHFAHHTAGLTDGNDVVIGADTYRVVRNRSGGYGASPGSGGGPYYSLLRKD